MQINNKIQQQQTQKSIPTISNKSVQQQSATTKIYNNRPSSQNKQ